MTDRPHNLLIIMSDEHTRRVLGCYGNGIVSTPNLDRLAARGTLFEAAYTPCPICVPARASFATGRYVHETGHWDNAFPYTGTPPSWGHALQSAGRRVESIGKLHYRNETDPTGFDVQQIPMHVVNGVGDLLGCVREPLPVRWKSRDMAEKIGPGETSYSRYDADIRETTLGWLEARAGEGADSTPWTAFVSFVVPHFPLIAPEPFFSMYADKKLAPTKPVPNPDHPWFEAFRKCFLFDNFTEEKTRVALASYYGLVSYLDDNIGQILALLERTGLDRTTRIIYVSDHGDNIGERGLWGKSNCFEESVGIPAIMAGPGIPAGKRSTTPVSLVDIYPTVLDAMALPGAADTALPGTSWLKLANAADDPERAVLSEYHAAGAPTGAFMLRKGRFKYVYYSGMPAQLYDLASDPGELTDLGNDPAHAATRAALEAELRRICDPDAVDSRAKRDQAAKLEAFGGREAIVSKGGFGATPPPGEKPTFA